MNIPPPQQQYQNQQNIQVPQGQQALFQQQNPLNSNIPYNTQFQQQQQKFPHQPAYLQQQYQLQQNPNIQALPINNPQQQYMNPQIQYPQQLNTLQSPLASPQQNLIGGPPLQNQNQMNLQQQIQTQNIIPQQQQQTEQKKQKIQVPEDIIDFMKNHFKKFRRNMKKLLNFLVFLMCIAGFIMLLQHKENKDRGHFFKVEQIVLFGSILLDGILWLIAIFFAGSATRQIQLKKLNTVRLITDISMLFSIVPLPSSYINANNLFGISEQLYVHVAAALIYLILAGGAKYIFLIKDCTYLIEKIKELDSKYPKNKGPLVFKKILKRKYYTDDFIFGNKIFICSFCDSKQDDDSCDEGEGEGDEENSNFSFSFGDDGDECDDNDDEGDGEGGEGEGGDDGGCDGDGGEGGGDCGGEGGGD